MKKSVKIAVAGAVCLSLAGCSKEAQDTEESGILSEPGIVVESNVSDFNMYDSTEPEEVGIEPGQVVYDDQGLKVTADSIETDSTDTYIVLILENSMDQTITVTGENVTVNGYMIESYFSEDLDPDSEIYTGIDLPNYVLNAADITTIMEVSFQLSVMSYEEFTPLFDTDVISITTDQYDKAKQTVNESGTIIYDENDIKIICKGFMPDAEGGLDLIFLVMNNSDRDIDFCLEDDKAVIDGTECANTLDAYVLAGNKGIFYLYILDENGETVQDLQTVTASFLILDGENGEEIGKTERILLKNQ